MEETDVVICFLRNRGEVLVLRRSDAISSYAGRWGTVAGHAEGDSDAAAHEEIGEETGLADAVSLVRASDPFTVVDEDLGMCWIVHPYLFDCDSRAVETNDETSEFEWMSPTEILCRETVPDLWKSYERVAPTVENVREDTKHGSAWLSMRALEILRDRAGVLATSEDGPTEDESGWGALATLADDLRGVRPSMTVVTNRINQAMANASERTPEAVERAAREGIERAHDADETAAREAVELVGNTVLTLSRSGTVLEVLRRTNVAVIVCESRPAREGVGVAEQLADETRVTLAVDASAAHLLAERPVDAVLVGADTVFPDGSVLNKVGTRSIALAAAREDVPVYAVTAADKIHTDCEAAFEDGDRTAVYDGEADIEVANPTFDRTPAELVTVVTERGPLTLEEIKATAEKLRGFAAWSREPPNSG